MDLKFKGRVALVTGTGSQVGFGKTIALTLAKEGCDKIICADIDFEGAKKTAAEVEALGSEVMVAKVDVTNRAEVDDMVKNGLEKFRKIEILVNNAGASTELKPFAEMTREEWDFDIGVNLYGQMNVAQAVLPHMMARQYGRIVNTSGGQGVPNISVYGAAKGGIDAFTESLAREVGAMGIIVNAVSPALGHTGLTKSAPPQFLEAVRNASLLGRLCTGEDVAMVVAFLASDVCSYMTGQILRLNTSFMPS